MNLQIVTAFLELLFIFVILAALCHQRNRIGVAPVTMSFGAVMFFGMLMDAAEVTFPLPWGGEFDVAQVVVFQPLLATFLMVYITTGVLRGQRLLLGIMCSFLLYIYFVMMIRIQCTAIPAGPLRDVVEILLADGSAEVNLNAVSNLISFFCLPLLYGAMPRKMENTLRIIIALEVAVIAGVIPEYILLRINGEAELFPWASLQVESGAALFLGVILSMYLVLLEKDFRNNDHGALDFIFAFFGSYSRVKELEDDLAGWENRYHLILRHTAEGIIMTDANGYIREVNIAAGEIFTGGSGSSLIGRKLFPMLQLPEGVSPLNETVEEPRSFICTIDCAGKEKTIAASLSPVQVKNKLLLVMVARDISGEIKLAREKEELTEQLMHSQRMESLGMLAGGIAHDFNNCIHAIMGHADVAGMLYTGDPEKVAHHLQNISSIAEKAGKLTSQLLGFARKGKYNVVDIDLVELLRECTGMLDPFRIRGVDFRCQLPEKKLILRGDMVQMQQVVLNLLINALDATSGNSGERIITLTAGESQDSPLPMQLPPEYPASTDDRFLFFSVEDNGSGMDEETKKKIFEPFFTTKPVGSGTGMGLAMVYGTVTHHKGWIQVESSPGKGTLFCFFFPHSG